jgi:hypothetical protein
MSKDNISSGSDRRVFTRIPFQTKARLNTFPGTHLCTLVDISLKGALVERDIPWSVRSGDRCSLSVELGEHALAIQMAGEIVHVHGTQLGIRCIEIDLESITNLRRLIELNLADEDTLNRELGAMMQSGSKPGPAGST